ncbi:MAG: gamma-glutamylcyclotransferase [Pseudomonadota bacterium]
MPIPDSAFRHHPNLVSRVTPPEQSFFRELDLGLVDDLVAEQGLENWRRPDADREADRRRVVGSRPDDDLWVFAYASLMWDPALLIDELRRAHSTAHCRRFNLLDSLGRGSRQQPGLQSTLVSGEGCTGYALRVPAARIEAETTILWKREMISYGYIPEFIPLQTDFGQIDALAFLANPASDYVLADVDFETQVQMIAKGVGVLGPCRDNVENLATHLKELEITDHYVFALRDAVRTYGARG